MLYWPKTLKMSSGVAIIITVAAMVELIFFVEYIFAQRGIRQEVVHRAETELRVKNLEIQKVMVAVETAISNTLWAVENGLQEPDSLYATIQRMVEQTPTIVGGGLMFRPNYYPHKGRWFEPYVAQRADGSLEAAQIGSAQHDYLSADFYVNGMKAGGGCWSEPYYDDTGARMMLCTYTTPVCDACGDTVALLGADVSLEWLSAVINASRSYPSSYNVVISRKGLVLVGPDEKYVLHNTIQEVTAGAEDTMMGRIIQSQMNGESGHQDIIGIKGEKMTVFYGPIDGQTGWSMSVVCNRKDIYGSLWRVTAVLLMLSLAGMLLLAYIIYRAARSARKLSQATAEKERIGSELRIARDIQESMLPKTFPPFPDRNDVDIYASLTPAKEVGGDLYDFHIRDEKLFFCIGDVAGKGVPASLVMAVTRSLFRSVSAQEDAPETIVSKINEAMADMNQSDMFVTLIVGVLDLSDGTLHYCNAGHEEPLLIGKGVGVLPCGEDIPVGMMPGWQYKGQEAQIFGGTVILLYTDGLTEGENASSDQFGKQRVMRTARRLLSASAHPGSQDIIEGMKAALKKHVGTAEQSDDLTMLAIRYRQQ